jgi:hypothetical protein
MQRIASTTTLIKARLIEPIAKIKVTALGFLTSNR